MTECDRPCTIWIRLCLAWDNPALDSIGWDSRRPGLSYELLFGLLETIRDYALEQPLRFTGRGMAC